MDVTSYLLGKKAGGGGGQPSLQSKSITITENGTQNVTADSGYDGLSNVSVTTNVSGGGGLDWSAIGYSGEPQAIQDGYDYAVEIMENWDATKTYLTDKFKNDFKLIFLPLINTSNAIGVKGMFNGCNSLLSIPLIDTSNVTTMNTMFSQCYALSDVPILNTSKVTIFTNAFSNCRSLTDTSLDNILQMCINAISYTDTKTLLQLGINSTYYPASRIQALPHYQDFLDAGWTIGY